MKIFTSSTPRSLARHKPSRNASYLAWLFEVGKDNKRETSNWFPSSFSNIMHVSLPGELEAPLTKIIHQHAPSRAAGEVISDTKLASA